MPTLFRFLYIVAVIAGGLWGGIWALATFVEPRPREITVKIPSERVNLPDKPAQTGATAP